MRYISLFSGVEAASVAWEPLGWEPVAFCEIDDFPSAVLAHRYPSVPNIGDITKVDWKEVIEKHGTVDLVVGGSPCQSFSVAGKRESLQGASRLMFEYIRAVAEIRPRWFVWENVPGALSAKGLEGEAGGAFRQLLREMGELGYGMAWRVLDAQFARVPDFGGQGLFGPVAQRRRRVFLVGHTGDDPSGPVQVLFEREGLRGDNPPSREKREALAAAARGSSAGASAGFKFHQGSGAGGVGYGDEQSTTLTTDWHQPAVLTVRTANTNANGHGIAVEATHTLDGANGQAVCIQGSVIGRANENGPRGGGATKSFRSPSTRSTAMPSHSPRTSAARSDWRAFDGTRAGALAANPDFGKGQGASLLCMTDTQSHARVDEELGGALTAHSLKDPPVVAMADDNRNAAVDLEICGSLKVGGGSAASCVASNGEDVTGPLCARDHKGVGSEYVNEGKVVLVGMGG